MIPAFDTSTGNLPAGLHAAHWHELVERFGRSGWRRRLLAGMLDALRLLRAAGCERAYIDGSFVTAKDVPGDYDACWDACGVDFDLLDTRLLTFDAGRKTQKAAFGGEWFVADWEAVPQGVVFLDFFQQDRDGRPKGIVAIELKGLP